MPVSACLPLEIADLRKAFGSIQAIDGVSFTLAEGQRLAFLGPNGAGKTTLIRCLCRRTRVDAGQIRLFGQPINDVGVQRWIGLVPQDIALYGDLTTRENLSAFGRFHGLTWRETKQRVDWALEWTGLADRADDLVGRFSGGMKRRVNLACGVLHRPRILLLDEPTVGVDPQSRQRIFAMLDELKQQGTSILLTTHHLDEAQQRCDRILIMDKGRVVADGSLNELIDRTVGQSRIVRLRIDRPLSEPIRLEPQVRPDVETTASIGKAGERIISTRINDVSDQLTSVLESTRRSGYEVFDVEVQAPSLHHVFLHLTGYELRD